MLTYNYLQSFKKCGKKFRAKVNMTPWLRTKFFHSNGNL